MFQNEQQARRANGNHLGLSQDDEDAAQDHSGSFGFAQNDSIQDTSIKLDLPKQKSIRFEEE